MAGVIYTAIAAVALGVGLNRSRQWLAREVAGRRGALWCMLAALCVGVLTALLVCAAVPAGGAGWKRHLAYLLLMAPVAAVGVLLCRRRPAAAVQPAESCTVPAADGPAPAESTVAALVPAQAPPRAVPATPASEASVTPAPRRPVKVRQEGSRDPAPGRPRPGASVPPPAAGVPSERGEAQADPSNGQPAAPTTVTECVLSMSISCEEYILQNFVQMAQAPLPDTQRDTIRRLVEETDDKLARLRAARHRHHGEEVVRVSWSQLPEVDLPVVKSGASVDQVREKAIKQTQVMIDFYRTVAAYVQRPSLKSLLVNLALDGQRHLAVIEQTST